MEHYAGAFPLWLAPEQGRILPVSEKQTAQAFALRDEFRKQGFRVEVDDQSAGLGAKIREARSARLPYIFVLGEKEAGEGTLAVRSRREGELGAMKIAEIIEKMKYELENKVI